MAMSTPETRGTVFHRPSRGLDQEVAMKKIKNTKNLKHVTQVVRALTVEQLEHVAGGRSVGLCELPKINTP
jgi:hypothetical protein